MPVTGTDDEVVNSLPPEFWRTSLMIVGRLTPVALAIARVDIPISRIEAATARRGSPRFLSHGRFWCLGSAVKPVGAFYGGVGCLYMVSGSRCVYVA